jgi:hypothetical protein
MNRELYIVVRRAMLSVIHAFDLHYGVKGKGLPEDV